MTDMLAYYKSVETASDAMLAAARCRDWDALVAAEQRCAAVIALLKAADAEARLTRTELSRKAQIIRRVLAQDAEIRRLLDPRMHELEQLLNAAGARRRVDRAYGA